MANPNAPDYYEQVTRESSETIKADDQKIADCVMGVTERRHKSLRYLLEQEFGRVAVRHADLHEFFDLLHETAAEGAEVGKGVIIGRHHAEAQKSAGSMLRAVMVGREIGRQE